MAERIATLKDAQALVKRFAERNGWKDSPSIDKFDHLHEELVEMSKLLRYKTEEERIAYVKGHKGIFVEETGDLLFALCRLANQLGVDLEEAFAVSSEKVLRKNGTKGPERKITGRG